MISDIKTVLDGADQKGVVVMLLLCLFMPTVLTLMVLRRILRYFSSHQGERNAR